MVRIKEFRLRKGLKQKQLGKMIGVSESTISLYESGNREPDTKTWLRLADILGATVDELIGRETDTAPQEDDDLVREVKGLDEEERIKVKAFIGWIKKK